MCMDSHYTAINNHCIETRFVVATLQIRVDDTLKKSSDTLFAGLGLDTPTAVRIFLTAAQEYRGFPFNVRQRREPPETLEALEDARLHRNLHGPHATGEEAVAAMLAD